MLDIVKHIKVGDKEYPMAFTLNVMEAIQEKYGSLDAWTDIIDPEEGGPAFKDIKWVFAEFINEGIDIENEEKGEKRDFVTTKQVGRIITVIGIDGATFELTNIMSQSMGEVEEKND